MKVCSPSSTIIFMSDILCITNRTLCSEDFLVRIEKLAKAHPKAIVLREKDLSEEHYIQLAEKVMDICRAYDTPCILHSFVNGAISLHCTAIHLPLFILRQMTENEKRHFSAIGASCHSVEDAREAQRLGCTYITAGHVFDTDCKKGLPGRGLDFLRTICGSVSIPVYAIGGIDKTNFGDVKKAGAVGACVMSGLMKCENADAFLEDFENEF